MCIGAVSFSPHSPAQALHLGLLGCKVTTGAGGGPGTSRYGGKCRLGSGIAGTEGDLGLGRAAFQHGGSRLGGRCVQKGSREHGEIGRGECMEILVK